MHIKAVVLIWLYKWDISINKISNVYFIKYHNKMYWKFRDLIRVCIFIKHTSLCQFAYNGFKVHRVRTSSASEKCYTSLVYLNKLRI